MPHLDILFNQMEAVNIEAAKIKSNIESFKLEMQKVNDSIDNNVLLAPIRADAITICEFIKVDIETRFSFGAHLVAANLFLKANINKYEFSFPKQILNQVCEAYPFLDANRLEIELRMFYSRSDFHNYKSINDIKMYIKSVNLHCSVFKEMTKLLNILLTIPMTTAEPERLFSTLKRIKTALRNNMGQNRLNALAAISINVGFFESKIIAQQ